jgi:fructose-1-phosphate kinase PfkB-like protein
VEGRPFDEALRLATAAGAANALQLGAGCLRRADVDLLFDQVRTVEETLA